MVRVDQQRVAREAFSKTCPETAIDGGVQDGPEPGPTEVANVGGRLQVDVQQLYRPPSVLPFLPYSHRLG